MNRDTIVPGRHPRGVPQHGCFEPGVVVRTIRVASTLSIGYRPELERIVFFNPEQNQVTVPLVASVRRYGIPETIESAASLRFRVRAFGEVQTLFALDDTEGVPRLAGVVMFTRESTESMLVLHLAIHEHYTARGAHARAGVTGRLLAAVRRLSMRTRGVESLRMVYPRPVRVALRKPRVST